MQYLTKVALLLVLGLNPVQANDLTADELVKMLQQGGYVVYLRHAATDLQQKDSDRKNLENCGTQRNLSELGKQQAMAIGAGFKTKKISVGKILSSPWCRTKDTAYLGFGRAEITTELSFSISKSSEDTQRLSTLLNIMLTQQPEVGTNTILVSHSSNLKEAAGVWPKPEAVMVVFKPDQNEESGYKYYGMIKPNYWLGLAEN